MIRSILISLFAILTMGSLFVAIPVHAQSAPGSTAQDVVCKEVENTDFGGNCKNPGVLGPDGLITKIVQLLVFVIGAVSVLVIVIGGFRYVVSGGDPNGTKGAKDMILYAIIGVIIALMAQAIVTFVLARV